MGEIPASSEGSGKIVPSLHWLYRGGSALEAELLLELGADTAPGRVLGVVPGLYFHEHHLAGRPQLRGFDVLSGSLPLDAAGIEAWRKGRKSIASCNRRDVELSAARHGRLPWMRRLCPMLAEGAVELWGWGTWQRRLPLARASRPRGVLRAGVSPFPLWVSFVIALVSTAPAVDDLRQMSAGIESIRGGTIWWTVVGTLAYWGLYLALSFRPRIVFFPFLVLMVCMYPIPKPGALVILAFCALALAAYRVSVRSLVALWAYVAGTLLFIAPGLAIKILRERIVRNERVRRASEARNATIAAEQRMELARELHDVITHGLTIIAVHANLGKISSDGEQQREALVDIGDMARSSLEDLRRLLQTMRAPGTPTRVAGSDDQHIALSSESLDLAPILVDSRRRLDGLGMATCVNVEGDLQRTPNGLRTTAARILQESATNVVKHSGAGADCEIAVHVREEQIELIVRNRMTAGPPRLPASGTGLVGLRERVSSLGGNIAVGPVDGWWRVHAVLPFRVPPSTGYSDWECELNSGKP